MPKRVPVQTVIVQRDGKQVSPKIGEAFDFTADELADIKRLNPGAVRIAVNEDVQVADTAMLEHTSVQVDGAEADAAVAAAKAAAKAEAKTEVKPEVRIEPKAPAKVAHSGGKGHDL